MKMPKGIPAACRKLGAFAVVGVVAAFVAVGSATAATPRALINADTVSGGTSSLEAQQAAADGFAVDVVSGSAWDSMSASDFAQYQVLIIGDPTCNELAGSATSNVSTWAPVVMGTAGGNSQAGNRIVIGTDPVYHYTYGHPGAIHLLHDGIAFAGAVPGRTGVYFDDSCGDYYTTPSALDVLNALSTGSGSWSENSFPPCGGSASLIASNASFSTLSSGDLQGWGCSVHESFPTYRSDWSPLAVATDAPTHPTCGTDKDTGQTACGEAYILVAGSDLVLTAPDITVTPADSTDPAGGTHTVTAHVEQGGSPLVGQTVTFTVSGQNGGATGTCSPAGCATDSNGDVSFTYADSNGAGDDTIVAGFTSGGTNEQASAAEHWVGPTEQPVSAAGTTLSGTEGAPVSGTLANVTDPDTAATAGEYSASVDWGDGSPAESATLSGSAGAFTVDGTHTYADEGSYTVTVTITDTDTPDNTATATTSVTVGDAALSATGTSIASTEGSSFSGTVGSFTDANAAAPASDFTAAINWGDGNTSTGTVSGSGGSYTVAGSHTYADEGSYSVTVTITDVGGSTATATTAASVADAALAATGAPAGTSLPGYAGTVATFTDANTGAPASDFTATIDWGDGNTSIGTVTGSGGSYSVAGSHTYAATGPYTITVTITDDGGSTATATTSLLVYAFAPGGGAFVVGDQSATGSVLFWGAQWAKTNGISGGAASSSFKGYANTVSISGGTWSTDPGDSSAPPAGPLPAYMGVIVTSSTSRSGSTISGTISRIVIVQTDGGYQPNPGHAGTGTVVGTA